MVNAFLSNCGRARLSKVQSLIYCLYHFDYMYTVMVMKMGLSKLWFQGMHPWRVPAAAFWNPQPPLQWGSLPTGCSQPMTEHSRAYVGDQWLIWHRIGFGPSGHTEPFLNYTGILDISTQPPFLLSFTQGQTCTVVWWLSIRSCLPLHVLSHRCFPYRNLCSLISFCHLLLREPRLTQSICRSTNYTCG